MFPGLLSAGSTCFNRKIFKLVYFIVRNMRELVKPISGGEGRRSSQLGLTGVKWARFLFLTVCHVW